MQLELINIPIGHYIRTLADVKTAKFIDFDISHFADRDADGDPFWSSHTIWEDDGLWIGDIFRDRPDDLWQCRLIGLEKIKGAWESFQPAIDCLFQWQLEYKAYQEANCFKSALATAKDAVSISDADAKPKRKSRKKSA